MRKHNFASRILWYEGLGFFTILALSWFNELIHLNETKDIFSWEDALSESTAILLVALPVMYFTKRLVSRLHYLEGFLRVCAWCQKLEYNNEWIQVAEYFEEKFQTKSTHGICMDCLSNIQKNQNKKISV